MRPDPRSRSAVPPTATALVELLGSTRSARAPSSLAATTSSCSRAPSAAPVSTRPSCGCVPTIGVSRSRSTAGRVGSLDPRVGGLLAILEAARNVACVGGEPLGFTDCLNFGNPEKPEIGWELAESIEGMAQACEALGLPIVSGNVSLYNDTDGRSIHPTPVVGCVGTSRTSAAYRGAGAQATSCSWPARRARSRSRAPSPRPATAPAAASLCSISPPRSTSCASSTEIASRATLVHDVADGGLAVALAEAALWSDVGALLDVDDDPVALFGEVGGQVIFALPSDQVEVDPTGSDVQVRRIGTVGGDEMLGVSLADLRAAYEGTGA